MKYQIVTSNGKRNGTKRTLEFSSLGKAGEAFAKFEEEHNPEEGESVIQITGPGLKGFRYLKGFRGVAKQAKA